MASTTCGYCGRLAHMQPASDLHIIGDGFGGGTQQAAFTCASCLHLSVATLRVAQPSGVRTQVIPASSVTDLAWQSVWPAPSWLPRHGDVREFEDVPEHIAQAASEATLCLSVGAYRAVGALARAVIEATAKDRGAKGSNLEKRIDALREAEHIRPHTQEQAHEVRHFGNEMAHGDFVEPVTKEEAEEVIELMAEVLEEVYQSPARLQKRRSARLAKSDPAG